MAVLHRMFRQPVGLEPDWTFTQESDRYSEADHRTWISLYDRPAEIVSRRACNAFLNGLDALDLHGQRVPDFDQLQLNEELLAFTGWHVVAVPGLVPDAVYFDHLANRRFLAANFIRRANELDYSQKPNIFHDVFSHVPILSTVSFDAFLFELCLSTLSGERLILAPPEQTPPGERLAAFAASSGVTHRNLLPTALNMRTPDSLSTCPNLIVAGESPAPQVVEQWSFDNFRNTAT